MKEDKADEKLKTQADLEELPVTTFAKNMRNVEDILADVAVGNEISLDEERLVDAITFQKTGKRYGKFKNPKKSKIKSMPVISSRTNGHGQKELDRPR